MERKDKKKAASLSTQVFSAEPDVQKTASGFETDGDRPRSGNWPLSNGRQFYMFVFTRPKVVAS